MLLSDNTGHYSTCSHTSIRESELQLATAFPSDLQGEVFWEKWFLVIMKWVIFCLSAFQNWCEFLSLPAKFILLLTTDRY